MCKDNYTGKTERIVISRWEAHNKPTHDSEPAEHLKSNLN